MPQKTSPDNPQILLVNNIAKTNEVFPARATDGKMPTLSVLPEKAGEKISDTPASVNPLPPISSDKKTPAEAVPVKNGFFSMFQRKKNISETPPPSNAPTGTPPLVKKSLPPNVRDHFEANSSAFVAFAQGKDTKISQKIEESKEMDVWDRALLLGEYPGGKIPVEIRTPSDIKEPVIPKKPLLPMLGRTLPNQFFPETPKETVKTEAEKEKDAKHAAPISISPETMALPHFIPRKPASAAGNEIKPTAGADKKTTDEKIPEMTVLPHFVPRKPAGAAITIPAGETKNSPSSGEEKSRDANAKKPVDISFGGLMTSLSPKITDLVIPKKPSQNDKITNFQTNINMTQPTAGNQTNIPSSATPEPGLGEQLQKKIIEGQMKSIFEDAPAGTRETLEKTLARDILSAKNIAGENQKPENVWEGRLRDYIIKLKWQGKTALEKTEDTDPKEDETVAAFIQRIYPSVIKVEMKEE
jgi:hypothetical protein